MRPRDGKGPGELPEEHVTPHDLYKQYRTVLQHSSEAIRFYGYRCNDYWIQRGDDLGFVPEHANLWVLKKCKSHLIEAAYSAKDRFHCNGVGGYGDRIVAYSSYGYEACRKKKPIDHAPCEMRPPSQDHQALWKVEHLELGAWEAEGNWLFV
ncbi:hypothetical protein CERZMDRAFT_103245 [Cercospora zeae-maydis SCOH1-5]|uniref:Uncharacterized protein n=1 Tax=Cercospora zeae-maydis SCOH1-5 TaxID=717836 RepID=A0A6A6F221_9PEZI|nr:hypothetical protein CERZMDRAFT_103245 [Cercospora zeae-maydis SCOH1-5]